MIALGLNGWVDRTHDAAAALVVDGELVAFVEQERLSRRKHAVGEVPHAAVGAVLALGGIEPQEVDLIAYGWDLPLFNAVRGRELTLDPGDAVEILCGFKPGPGQEVRWVDHHLAHAASAYYGSGFESAAALVVDAEGETGSTSIYAASREGGLRRVVHLDRAGSLGFLFRGTSAYCGFGEFGAGQVMGLAPYGAPASEHALTWRGDHVAGPLAPEVEEDRIAAAWCRWLESRFGPPAPSARHAPWQVKHPDAARMAQETVESLVVELAGYAAEITGSRSLCMAGGVALNCVANSAAAGQVDRLYVPPAPHDAGVAMGAAFAVAAEAGERIRPIARADLGPSYDDGSIEATLIETGHRYMSLDDPAQVASDLLQRDQVVGWFQGRMEAGPRALGQRSILARADDRRLRDRTNDVKDRQRWRPLAPSVRVEDASRLFEGAPDSPFMLLSSRMTPDASVDLPAVAHVDGSARLQTVPADGSRFRGLLDRVAAETGAGVVLNTSFNGAGEPIVCTPLDAIRSFQRIGLDALVIGSFLIRRGGLNDR